MVFQENKQNHLLSIFQFNGLLSTQAPTLADLFSARNREINQDLVSLILMTPRTLEYLPIIAQSSIPSTGASLFFWSRLSLVPSV